MKSILQTQKGTALLHLLPAFILVASIAFVGGSVYQAQQRKADAARQASADAEAKKQQELAAKQQQDTVTEKEVEVPAPLPEEKQVATTPKKTSPPKTTTDTTKTEKSYTSVNIETTSASVGADSVKLTAKLPGSYQGTCKALVKLPDGSNAMWLEAGFGPSDTCSVDVSKSKLTAGSEWKFYMYFYSSDYSTKGASGGNQFTL